MNESYPLTWITNNIAVGPAPMSYAQLASISEQGIDGIVNLCGEFSDLHEIEQTAGFDVFFLPIADETAPDMADMEKGLAWLDEATYLGKKILVHCRHGMGRTGTFITAYLLRRGFSLKKAEKLLKSTRANPTNFSQWWLLRKYGKKEGRLTLQEPVPDNRPPDELQPFLKSYEELLAQFTREYPGVAIEPDHQRCTYSVFMEITLIEALYLHRKVNTVLTAEQRRLLFETAAPADTADATNSRQPDHQDRPNQTPSCPLARESSCRLHAFRPLQCRIQEYQPPPQAAAVFKKKLAELSREVFLELFDISVASVPPVRLIDVLSGRYIQIYFQFLSSYKADAHHEDR